MMNDIDFCVKQEAELDAYEEKHRRYYERGKKLIYLIAGTGLLWDIAKSLITHKFSLITIIIHTAVAVALIYGVSWIRYLYIVSCIIAIVAIVISIPSLIKYFAFLDNIWGELLTLMLVFVYTMATLIILFSKSVKEYMYRKKMERS